MRRASLLFLFLVACTTAAPPPVDEQTRSVIAQLTEAVRQQPENTARIYVLATFHDQARQSDEVVRWLNRLDELHWDLGVNPIDFPNTKTQAFRDVVGRLDARLPRVSNARVAFTIAGHRDLVPEGITYDPTEDVFYLSSIKQKKVVRVDRAGNARDFVSEGQDGMIDTLGMKVDARRRLLWVVSSSLEAKRSMLFAYDLRDAHLLKKIEATPALLNDITLLDDGTVFATDMGRGKVMRLAPGGDALEEWASDFLYPNGIAASADQRFLYVADFRGVTRFALRDKHRETIETTVPLNGIDGLTFHEGTLIGIQNAIGKPRVLRIHPDDSSVQVLESKNDRFEIPLTGTMAGDDYYFIANPGLKTPITEDLVMLTIRR